MLLMKGLTMRRYVAMNVFFAALLGNTLVFGPSLRMGEAFTAGLETGLGFGWLIFIVVGWRELKRPGRAFDERVILIVQKAGTIAFWAMILASCVASILLRSDLVGWEIEARELAALLSNLGLVVFLAAWAILGRIL